MKIAAFIKSTLTSFIIFSFLLFSSGIVLSASGAIWTTSGSCGTPQNINHYSSGSVVYVNGDNFNANTSYAWEISDPGNGNSTTYLSGSVVTTAAGAFCFAAGIVPDGGPYQAKVSNVKGDNFSIDAAGATPTPTLAPTSTPTFTPTATPTSTPVVTPTATPDPGTSTPSATPTATPIIVDATPTPTPSPSPVLGDSDTNDVCLNIDGIQTDVPSDYHLDASGVNCVQFSQSGGGDNGNGGNGGQVLGASTIGSTETSNSKQGQVLGASTLGATGTDQKLMIALYMLGGLAISCGVGIYSFSKEDLVVDMDSRI